MILKDRIKIVREDFSESSLFRDTVIFQNCSLSFTQQLSVASVAQVILRWHMQRGLITIPRCDNDDYTDENIRIFDFELSPKDMETISGLNKNQRTYEKNNPDDFPW